MSFEVRSPGLPKANAVQALMKTPEQRPSTTQLLQHPWLTAFTNPTPPQPSIGPQTPRQTQEAAPSHNYSLGDVPLHNKLTGTDQYVQHPVNSCEAADNTLCSTHGVQTSAVGVPQGSPQGSCRRDHGGARVDDDGDWAIQAWAEEQPAALWMSQEVRQQFAVQCRSVSTGGSSVALRSATQAVHPC